MLDAAEEAPEGNDHPTRGADDSSSSSSTVSVSDYFSAIPSFPGPEDDASHPLWAFGVNPNLAKQNIYLAWAQYTGLWGWHEASPYYRASGTPSQTGTRVSLSRFGRFCRKAERAYQGADLDEEDSSSSSEEFPEFSDDEDDAKETTGYYDCATRHGVGTARLNGLHLVGMWMGTTRLRSPPTSPAPSLSVSADSPTVAPTPRVSESSQGPTPFRSLLCCKRCEGVWHVGRRHRCARQARNAEETTRSTPAPTKRARRERQPKTFKWFPSPLQGLSSKTLKAPLRPGRRFEVKWK